LVTIALVALATIALCSQALAAAKSGHSALRGFPDGDWTRFDFNAARSGAGPTDTGITARNIGRLKLRRVKLDGTVDSSPVQLHGVKVRGQVRDLVIVATTYGRAIALDPSDGHKLWEFTPSDIKQYSGSAQITTASPVLDPDRRYVYTASPDGRIHKLAVNSGRQMRSRHWPARITFNPTHEKIGGSLNISGPSVVVATGGYWGDVPPYQGHVVLLRRRDGRVTAVWNALCSGRHRLMHPKSCPADGAAIWGRSGAVIEPGSRRILIATGNAPFNGSTSWGDSVLELSADGHHLLHNWTPTNQAFLNSDDLDLGSTSPAVLPKYHGFRLALQGGKAQLLDLLDLNRLDGRDGPAGPRLGGELQQMTAPGPSQFVTAPASWNNRGHTYVFVADWGATAAYVLGGASSPRLHRVWRDGLPGSSPVVAGGLLYVFNPLGGTVDVFEPTTGKVLTRLPAAPGHWNSPIVDGGRVIVGTGSANDHATHGTLYIYHLPGR
jgi:outer membrane protein assembly factor BamB